MAAVVLLALLLAAPPPPVLKVGVTLHPYYSWTANVAAGLPISVVPVLPPDVDVGNYQPRPEDVAKLEDLDALIINGLGHDDFIRGMLKASGNTRCRLITPNDGTPLLKTSGGAVNSHTFLSYTNAILQTFAIARALGELRPGLVEALQKNASAYAKRLRSDRANALERLSKTTRARRVITVHDGYRYFLQELGIELAGVVEPAHGLLPSAAELQQIVTLIEKQKVQVVLSEASFPPALREVLVAAGANVFLISHIASGAFTAERFEVEMRANVETLLIALK